jgi:toxin HigB-1
MEITITYKKLAKVAEDFRKLKKEFGEKQGTLIAKRLNDLQAATSLEDVRNLPGRYHELRQNRKGQWACDLDHPYRLIFIPHEDPIPQDEDGKFIWLEILGVEIIDIVDYH